MTAVVLVALGAAVGALTRYLAELGGVRLGWTGFPWATLGVNVGGSLLLGVLAGAAREGGLSQELVLLVGVGFCGAATTFSTFALQATNLPRRTGAGYVVASVAGALAACLLGYALGSSV